MKRDFVHSTRPQPTVVLPIHEADGGGVITASTQMIGLHLRGEGDSVKAYAALRDANGDFIARFVLDVDVDQAQRLIYDAELAGMQVGGVREVDAYSTGQLVEGELVEIISVVPFDQKTPEATGPVARVKDKYGCEFVLYTRHLLPVGSAPRKAPKASKKAAPKKRTARRAKA